MFIDSIAVKHYKSLDDVSVKLGPVTVIVGTNAVGKSNFVDVLRFLRDSVKDGLEHATISREGIDRIRQRYKTSPRKINISLRVQNPRRRGTPSTYDVVLSGRDGTFVVESEKSVFLRTDYSVVKDNKVSHSYSPGAFSRTKEGLVILDGAPYAHLLPPTELALGKYIDNKFLGQDIANFARSWLFYALYPNTLRKLGTLAKERQLVEDGSNWASVIRALQKSKEGKQALERVADVMRFAVPNYRGISIDTAGSYLVPYVHLETGSGESQLFDPIELSDGTLRLFSLLLALYQRPAPSFLVIEEPEQSLHPGVLPAFAEACKEVSGDTQIVITTHSPQLVDHFDPTSIRVATFAQGSTRINSVRESQVEAVKQHLMSLQELMVLDGLQPALAEE